MGQDGARFPAALASLRRRRGARERSGAAVAAAAAARSFGTLPWHVLEVLMSHVTGRQDVDAVRAARLVCRSWNAAVYASISTAIMRPMTRSCQDVDRQGRPIGVDVVDGSDGAAIRKPDESLCEALLESGYAYDPPAPESPETGGAGGPKVSVAEAEAAEDAAQRRWGLARPRWGAPGAVTPPDADFLGHYPPETLSDFEQSDSDSDDAAAATRGAAGNSPAARSPSARGGLWSGGRGRRGAESGGHKAPSDDAPLAAANEPPTGASRSIHRIFSALAHARGASGRHGSELPAAEAPHAAMLDTLAAAVEGIGADERVVLSNEELDRFSQSLRHSVLHDEGPLPEVLLRYDGSAAARAAIAAAAAAAPASGAPADAPPAEDGGSSGCIAAGGVVVPPQAAAAAPPVAGEVDDSATASADEDADGALEARYEELIRILERKQRGAAGEYLPSVERRDIGPAAPFHAARRSFASKGAEGEDPMSQYPTGSEDLLFHGPACPLPLQTRRALVSPKLRPGASTAALSLALLAPMPRLRRLVLQAPVHRVAAEQLSALTGLTALTLALRRRDRLGVAKALRIPTTPDSHAAVFAALPALPHLRHLDLSNSDTLAPRHVRAFTALTALASLDLTGVRLPLSTVAALAALTSLTALRIPHATLVAERFLELQSELPNVPPLEALLAALPRLRHLDLYWTGPGENQNIMKDGKYLKSLAVSASLRRIDLGKLQQVTDSTLAAAAALTGLTALKLGCNTWNLYRLTGKAFLAFRKLPHLRVLHLEALRNLTNDALLAIVVACPRLRALHFDSAHRVKPATFELVATLDGPEILEFVELRQVPNATVRAVCAMLPSLRAGQADRIIGMKGERARALAKFGEKMNFLEKLSTL